LSELAAKVVATVLLLDGVLAQSGRSFPARPWLDLERDRTSPVQSRVTVMVVDDNEQGLRVTARMLRDEGYHVIEAHSAEQALERLAETGEVQVVLTDIAMPGGMDGIELAEQVLAVAPWRRVVLMSGYARVFPQLGTAGFRLPLLIKPFSADQLALQIREVLGREKN
jgi:CheY-like chemotaxis protein